MNLSRLCSLSSRANGVKLYLINKRWTDTKRNNTNFNSSIFCNTSFYSEQQRYRLVNNFTISKCGVKYNSMAYLPNCVFGSQEQKPQHSYIGLIAIAILSSSEIKLVLSDIYNFILEHYPYFRGRGPGWRNSIRHNLSLNDCFVKAGRSSNGKGHYWSIHPANIGDFQKGDFRRRKAQRKVRKHMGLSMDENASDSQSPPPIECMPITVFENSVSNNRIPQKSISSATNQMYSYIHAAGINFLQSSEIPSWYFYINPTYSPFQCNISPQVRQILLYKKSYNQQDTSIACCTSTFYQNKHIATMKNLSSCIPEQEVPHAIRNSMEIATITDRQSRNLNSQARRRLFDVDSLLAPDNDAYKSENEMVEKMNAVF